MTDRPQNAHVPPASEQPNSSEIVVVEPPETPSEKKRRAPRKTAKRESGEETPRTNGKSGKTAAAAGKTDCRQANQAGKATSTKTRLATQAKQAKTLRRCSVIRRNVKPITPEALYDTGETPAVGTVARPALEMLANAMRRDDLAQAREAFQRSLKLDDSAMQAVIAARTDFAERLSQAVNEAQDRVSRARFVPLVARHPCCCPQKVSVTQGNAADEPPMPRPSKERVADAKQERASAAPSAAVIEESPERAEQSRGNSTQAFSGGRRGGVMAGVGIALGVVVMLGCGWRYGVQMWTEPARCLAIVDVAEAKRHVRAHLAPRPAREMLGLLQAFDARLADVLHELTAESGCVIMTAPAVLALPVSRLDYTSRVTERINATYDGRRE